MTALGEAWSGVDRVLRAVVEARRTPGIVAAVTNRRGVIYEGAYGSASASAGETMRVETVCRIASMTKLVTTVAVLQLVEQDRIELHAPFKRYFPEFRQPPVLRAFDHASARFTATPAARDVTVHDLLTHTSGYGYWFLNEEIRALAGAEPEFYNPPFLMCEPGTRFQYGISTDVLGQLIEPVTGLSLPAFFGERIFAPLGMVDTGYDPPREAGRLAALCVRTADGFTEAPREAAGEPPHGGGGLYSTARDFLALLRALLNGGKSDDRVLLSAATVATLASNQIGALFAERQRTALPSRTDDFRFMDGTQKFGLGVLLETRAKAGGRAAGSYGWAGIHNTYFWVDPHAGLAAVVLMQSSPFSTLVCTEICDAFERAVYEVREPRVNATTAG